MRPANESLTYLSYIPPDPSATAQFKPAALYVDKERGQIGIKSPDGSGLGAYEVPLSDVLALLRRTVL